MVNPTLDQKDREEMAGEYASFGPDGRTPRAPVRRLGAWKLAYADFLTALCALFIVMWLVSGTNSDDREEVARQFGAKPLATSTGPTTTSAPSPLIIAENALKRSALLSSDLGEVKMSRSANSIRIELLDLQMTPLFDTGAETLNDRGRALIGLAAEALTHIDYHVSIEGHTDSLPIARSDYSNWELSAGRANAARRELIQQGFPAQLIAGVAGLADTKPLDGMAAYLPQNRRLSIVVHVEERF